MNHIWQWSNGRSQIQILAGRTGERSNFWAGFWIWILLVILRGSNAMHGFNGWQTTASSNHTVPFVPRYASR